MFIQNLAPGATARAGLGAAELQAANPGLVVCDISGYGVGGPYETMKAYDLMVQSEAGLLSVTGTDDDVAKVGISVSDIAAGHVRLLARSWRRCSSAAAPAGARTSTCRCWRRPWSGWGSRSTTATTGAEPPQRAGAAHATIYPYGPFTARDDVIVMMAIQNEREWLAFCDRFLGRARAGHARAEYATNSARNTHRDPLGAAHRRPGSPS